MADYYDTLGVARGASEKDIRTAFRKLARKHHPDVNDSDPASEEKFKEDEVVYLSDKIYDYLRNRLDIENERTGWRVSQWVH